MTPPRRIAIAYDCIYPQTIGGQEFFFFRLCQHLADEGAQVTYLTRRQWEGGPPEDGGIKVIAVSASGELYDGVGRRRIIPTIRYAIGLFTHLIRNRNRYHTLLLASFPYFSVLAARLALIGSNTSVTVEWVEYWTPRFWREYAGMFAGHIGSLIQGLAAQLSPSILANSQLVADRLTEVRRNAPLHVIPGFLPDGLDATEDRFDPVDIFVLFGGRHIVDKGITDLPDIISFVIAERPMVRFVIAGDGPLSEWLKTRIDELGHVDRVDLPGFVEEGRFNDLLARAACVIQPSRREGYGIIVGAAGSVGTPVVVGRFAENASANLVVDGVNGFIVESPSPINFAKTAIRVIDEGVKLRESTQSHFQSLASGHRISDSAAYVAGVLTAKV